MKYFWLNKNAKRMHCCIYMALLSISAQLMTCRKVNNVIFHIFCLSCFSSLTAINNNAVCVQIFETVTTLTPSSCCEIAYGNTVHHVKICNFHLGNIFIECNMTVW